MISQDITIINKLGLHARAASKLVNLCSQFASSVYLDNKGNRVNAKSIMGVMMLAASKGTLIKLEVEGDDEATCFEAIVNLINNRFDEEE
jgi:phosphocarrier protein HPr